MASEPPRTPPYASPPFDNPKADLIIRSSDTVDFRVFSFILGMSSDVFSTMLEACQASSGDVRDGCPIIQLQEDSLTLDHLLRVIYPRKAPTFDDVSKVPPVLQAALKYDMEKAVEIVSSALRLFAPKAPLRVWCAAVRCGLDSEARAAADEMVRQSLQVLDLTAPELQDLHAGAYYRLLRYRRLYGSVEQDFTFGSPSPAQAASSASSAAEQDPHFVSPSHQRIHSLADVMCRSSDGVDFPAHRALLALASPTMGHKVADLPPPSVTASSGLDWSAPEMDLPVLPFDEDASTLRTLLTLCYPGAERIAAVQYLLVVKKVLDALERYKMEDAMVLVRRGWSRLVETDPLQAYLLAVQHGAEDEASKAQTQLFAAGRNMDDYYVPAMETTPASVYRTLLVTYRERRQRVSMFGGSVWSVAPAAPAFGTID